MFDIKSFGGILKEEDVRNYDLDKINKNLLGSSVVIPPISDNDYSSLKVEFQGTQPACGPHAFSRFWNVLCYRAGKTFRGSPRFFWNRVKKIDGFPLDAGTDINSLFKVGRNTGSCSYEKTGNDVTLSLNTYANGFSITSNMLAEALQNQTMAEAFIYKPTFEQICQTIAIHGACIILMRVGQNMYKGKNGLSSWAAKDILPLSPNRYVMDSGHFVDGENYNMNTGRIFFGNSFGETWGDDGTGYFDRDYMKYVDAIGVAVPKELITPDVIPPQIQAVIDHSPNWTPKIIASFLQKLRDWKVIK